MLVNAISFIRAYRWYVHSPKRRIIRVFILQVIDESNCVIQIRREFQVKIELFNPFGQGKAEKEWSESV